MEDSTKSLGLKAYAIRAEWWDDYIYLLDKPHKSREGAFLQGIFPEREITKEEAMKFRKENKISEDTGPWITPFISFEDKNLSHLNATFIEVDVSTFIIESTSDEFLSISDVSILMQSNCKIRNIIYEDTKNILFILKVGKLYYPMGIVDGDKVKFCADNYNFLRDYSIQYRNQKPCADFFYNDPKYNRRVVVVPTPAYMYGGTVNEIFFQSSGTTYGERNCRYIKGAFMPITKLSNKKYEKQGFSQSERVPWITKFIEYLVEKIRETGRIEITKTKSLNNSMSGIECTLKRFSYWYQVRLSYALDVIGAWNQIFMRKFDSNDTKLASYVYDLFVDFVANMEYDDALEQFVEQEMIVDFDVSQLDCPDFSGEHDKTKGYKNIYPDTFILQSGMDAISFFTTLDLPPLYEGQERYNMKYRDLNLIKEFNGIEVDDDEWG